ncbi:MAG: hypothetical protein RL040_448 [Bacteroidota bacterium]
MFCTAFTKMTKRIPYAAAVSFCILLMAACGNKKNGAVIAEVNGKQLTLEEIMRIVPDNSTAEDSAQLVERYVKDWATQQLLVTKAEETLTNDQQSFEERIEEYRLSLLTHAFEQEWVRQKLDTNVTDAEIQAYYDANEGNFELKDYIVQVKFCAVAQDSKSVDGVRKLFQSAVPEDLGRWEQACVDAGASFYFEEDTWMSWVDFIRQVPLEVYNVESFLQTNKNIEFVKENTMYLIQFIKYQLRGSKSPLSFERERIANMILNKRKQDSLAALRKDMYEQAMQDGTIKTYYTK